MSFSLTDSAAHAITLLVNGILPVHFQIWRNDRPIGSSVYALTNTFVSLRNTMVHGETFHEKCQAPTFLRAVPPAHGSLNLIPWHYNATVV